MEERKKRLDARSARSDVSSDARSAKRSRVSAPPPPPAPTSAEPTPAFKDFQKFVKTPLAKTRTKPPPQKPPQKPRSAASPTPAFTQMLNLVKTPLAETRAKPLFGSGNLADKEKRSTPAIDAENAKLMKNFGHGRHPRAVAPAATVSKASRVQPQPVKSVQPVVTQGGRVGGTNRPRTTNTTNPKLKKAKPQTAFRVGTLGSQAGGAGTDAGTALPPRKGNPTPPPKTAGDPRQRGVPRTLDPKLRSELSQERNVTATRAQLGKLQKKARRAAKPEAVPVQAVPPVQPKEAQQQRFTPKQRALYRAQNQTVERATVCLETCKTGGKPVGDDPDEDTDEGDPKTPADDPRSRAGSSVGTGTRGVRSRREEATLAGMAIVASGLGLTSRAGASWRSRDNDQLKHQQQNHHPQQHRDGKSQKWHFFSIPRGGGRQRGGAQRW